MNRLTLLELLLGPALIISRPITGSTVDSLVVGPLVATSLGLGTKLLDRMRVINSINKKMTHCNKKWVSSHNRVIIP